MPFIFILDLDEELFEDNPEEYIRRDIEGSDVDTRRRAACDLIKVLGKSFEQEIEKIFGAYVRVRLLYCKILILMYNMYVIPILITCVRIWTEFKLIIL